MPSSYDMETKLFLDFVYPEVKDLCTHFLTLVAGILVFSVTFSEKIVNFHTAGRWARSFLLGAWVLFVVAIAGGGTSMTALFLAAGRARGREGDWADLMVIGGYILFAAGGAFCFGLLSLAMAGAVSVLQGSIDKSYTTTPNEASNSESPAVAPEIVVKRDGQQVARPLP